MKKVFVFFLVLALSISTAFAGNMQRTYTTRDDVYKRVDAICQRAGVVGPSSFSPMNARALEIALDRIDTNRLSEKDQIEIRELYSILREENTSFIVNEKLMKFELGLSANLQINAANYKDFDFIAPGKHDVVRLNEQMIPYRFEDPAISIYPKFFFGNNVFLEADFALKNNVGHMFESSFGWLMTSYKDGFSFFGGKYATAYAPELPYKAGISAGNDYFNFTLGRYPHGIGSGKTGNLVVGDNFTYQEVANASFMSNFFTYNLSVTRFDVVENKDNFISSPTRQEVSGPQQFRVLHRFDFNIANVVRFAVDMATIYTADFGFDLRFFYPFVIGHNYYNYTNYVDKTSFDEANNISALYLDIALPMGFKITSQFVLDQYQTFFEDKTSVPSAYGALVNLSYSQNLGEGNINAYAEGVYTNPYLYLNGKLYEGENKNKYLDNNLDYFVGYHTQYLSDYNFSGYTFGPDSLVFAVGTSYDANNWNVGLDLMYKAQGRKRIRYEVTDIKNTNYDKTDGHIEKDHADRDSGIISTGLKNAEHLIQVKLNGAYTLEKYNLEFFGVAALNSYINYNLNLGETKVMPQMSLGIKWLGL